MALFPANFRGRDCQVALSCDVMPPLPLDVGDAIELSGLLEFLGDWLALDRDNLAGSLTRCVGSCQFSADLSVLARAVGEAVGTHLTRR